MTAASAPWRDLGLTDPEYDLICDKLEREPNGVELALHEGRGVVLGERELGGLVNDAA